MSTAVRWTPQQLALFERKGPKGKRAARAAPRPALERSTHIAIADLLRLKARPGVLWTHLAFGEYRTKKTAGLLKRLGVSPGWPDFIFIGLDGRVAFMELKRGNLGTVSLGQELFGSLMLERGVPYAVVRSYDEAVARLSDWGVLR